MTPPPNLYCIRPASLEAHRFAVALTVAEPDPQGQRLTLPAWIPGSYMIRDFARNIVAIRASCGGVPVALTKLDKQTWQAAACAGPLLVEYEVYAWDLSVRGAHLDQTHGYFNGTSVFLAVCGQEGRPCSVEIEPPPESKGPAFGVPSVMPKAEPLDSRAWRVATTLPRDGAPPLGFGRYLAADYEELIDHPVEMGTFDHAFFTAGGIPHEVALTGRQPPGGADLGRLCADLAPICETHIALFGGPPPMGRYLFQIQAVGDGYGGLEHRASTSLLCSRNDLPRPGLEEPDAGYKRLLGLCSHEYFHLWNVKRIRPAAFHRPDLSRELHTRQLWAFEGITSYYDDLALIRAGRIDAKAYLELVAQNLTRVYRTPGRFHQTVEESSFDAWTRFYKQDENAPNSLISYYAKGALIALALDLRLRLETAGARSLDDLMRELWRRHGETGVGVEEEGIERLASEIAGADLTAFFDTALRGTEDLDLEPLLAAFGVGMRLRPRKDQADQGGIGAPDAPPVKPRPTLGVRIGGSGEGATLLNCLDGGAAQRAGLSAQDVVIAVNGLRVGKETLESVIAATPEGAGLELHAFRRDELMLFRVRPLPAPADTCELWWMEAPTPEQQARRDAWLGVWVSGGLGEA